MVDKDKTPDEGKTEDQASDEAAERLERRAFFTEGFRSLMKPFSEAVESRLDGFNRAVEESKRVATGSGSDLHPASFGGSAGESRLLRPPGALAEELFGDRCACSAQCVSACPVKAIRVLESDEPRLNGTPYIDPSLQACVVCDDLACMKVCPSGALQSVPRHLIHIGVAELHRDLCVRTDGEDCRECVEKCPLGTEAIDIPHQGADVEVKEDGCIGCGVCEMYCPTRPRAITVKL